MYGLQAINAANGWAITVAGISIVFSGLLVLSTLLANMERFLRFWDRHRDLFKKQEQPKFPPTVSAPEPGQAAEQPPSTGIPTGIRLTGQQLEALNHFQVLSHHQGDVFSLPRLLETVEKRGISKPHSNLDSFLKLGLIVELTGPNRGFYRWNKDVRVQSREPSE